MKEKIKKISMVIPVLMVIVLLSANTVFADSYNIVASCTIPEIPGVNAPLLLEKETLEPNRMESVQEKEKTIQEDTQPALETIFEEKKEETNLAQEHSSFRLVRTIYDR